MRKQPHLAKHYYVTFIGYDPDLGAGEAQFALHLQFDALPQCLIPRGEGRLKCDARQQSQQ
ncbi:MAG: hypothetical protein WBP44_12930 [Gammaproteobacteria bacterium]